MRKRTHVQAHETLFEQYSMNKHIPSLFLFLSLSSTFRWSLFPENTFEIILYNSKCKICNCFKNRKALVRTSQSLCIRPVRLSIYQRIKFKSNLKSDQNWNKFSIYTKQNNFFQIFVSRDIFSKINIRQTFDNHCSLSAQTLLNNLLSIVSLHA